MAEEASEFLACASTRRSRGTIWVSTDSMEVDTSVTAKVWNQFITGKGVTFSSAGPDLTLIDKMGRVFGELSTQVNINSKRTGWSSFVNTTVKGNSDFVTIAGKGGILYHW